jgi:predicted metal-dependent phosphotriesterase family hydrolase
MMPDSQQEGAAKSKNTTRMVETVLGPIDAAQLGFCQAHEHLFIESGFPGTITPSLRIDDYCLTVAELHTYRKAGGQSLVDAQPVGCGRMARNLKPASEEAGVNIIGSTGFHKLVFYPHYHWIHTAKCRDLAELFKDELNQGMYCDGNESWPREQMPSRAGVIKAATDFEGVTAEYEKLFLAAASASHETSSPVICHTEMGSGALDQIVFLNKCGIPSDRIIVCHLDRTLDLPYHKEVASTGVFLEYDTIGRPKYHLDKEEIELIVSMLDAGFSRQLLLSLDTTRERLSSYGGRIGLNYLLDSFIPQLTACGVSSSTVHMLTVDNPAAALSRKGHRYHV